MAAAMVLALSAGACSGTAEWASPSSWWADDARAKAVAEAADAADSRAVPGADQPYPKLSQTPERPVPPSTAEQRQAITQGLISDRNNARYSDQRLRANGAAAAGAPVPQPMTQPAPQAAAQPMTQPTMQPAAPAMTAPAPAAPAATAMADSGRPMSVPSIVQRRGSLPPPVPSSIEEVSRQSVGRLVQRPAPVEPATTAALTPVEQAPLPQAAAPADTRTTQQATAQAIAREAATPAPRVMAQADTPAQPSYSQPAAVPSAQEEALIRSLPIGDDQAALVEAFAAGIAQQRAAATGAVSPATMFAAPNAAPISQWQASVPPIVRDSYNQALQESAPAPVQPLAPTSFAAPAPDPRYDMAMHSRYGVGYANGTVGGAPSSTGMAPALAALNDHPVVASNGSLAGLTTLNDIEPAAGGPLMVHFNHSSSRLNKRAQQEVGAIAEAVKSRGLTVRVIGHASQRTGDMAYSKHVAANRRISLARANSVARELRRNGVPKELIVVEARGDSDPLYYEFMPEGEAQNRRVEIFLQ